jgi:hypothetical protein
VFRSGLATNADNAYNCKHEHTWMVTYEIALVVSRAVFLKPNLYINIYMGIVNWEVNN